jgi:hypothetical protein
MYSLNANRNRILQERKRQALLEMQEEQEVEREIADMKKKLIAEMREELREDTEKLENLLAKYEKAKGEILEFEKTKNNHETASGEAVEAAGTSGTAPDSAGDRVGLEDFGHSEADSRGHQADNDGLRIEKPPGENIQNQSGIISGFEETDAL